jgi:hypothetical protein
VSKYILLPYAEKDKPTVTCGPETADQPTFGQADTAAVGLLRRSGIWFRIKGRQGVDV